MKYIFLITLSTVLLISNKTSADYSAHEQAGPFIDSMVKEHQFERQDLVRWLTEA
ncbi:MAG: lytic murein transglycosylase B, partial [Porticoccaceae bacterium]|nr:lytic murein transglycosylase B [Porticoccaceae bacterium]